MVQCPLILAVDDEPSILKLVSINLSTEGYRVITASDGTSALTLFDEYKPDLVILDIMMPGKDGFELIDEIRQRSQVPIIMLTGRDDVDSLRRALEDGADDYIIKPFNVHLLLARVHAKIRRSSTAENSCLYPGTR
ncbi:MAG: response regulator [Dehalococcoidales bacterium]|nr:response regulator [Dehalococcoidales bacterium]